MQNATPKSSSCRLDSRLGMGENLPLNRLQHIGDDRSTSFSEPSPRLSQLPSRDLVTCHMIEARRKGRLVIPF